MSDEIQETGAMLCGSVAPDGGSGEEAPRPAPPAGVSGPPSPLVEEYYLTFGVNYELDPHPRGSWIHPDGWVTVVAPDYHSARVVVVGLFGWAWSDLYGREFYDSGALDRSKFPRGELLRIVVPAGLVESEDHRV